MEVLDAVRMISPQTAHVYPALTIAKERNSWQCGVLELFWLPTLELIMFIWLSSKCRSQWSFPASALLLLYSIKLTDEDSHTPDTTPFCLKCHNVLRSHFRLVTCKKNEMMDLKHKRKWRCNKHIHTHTNTRTATTASKKNRCLCDIYKVGSFC